MVIPVQPELQPDSAQNAMHPRSYPVLRPTYSLIKLFKAPGGLDSRDSVIETTRHFFYVPPIFIDKKIFGTMSKNFKALN